MGLLRLYGLSGMWPTRDPRALPDNAAVLAVNSRSDGGAYLKGRSGPALVKTLAGATKTVYRLPLPGANTLANSYWMEFADIDTDVLRAPIVNDSYERIYWCSPSTGYKYRPKDDIVSGGTAYTVGVPPPATAPTAAAVAGTGELDDEGNNKAPTETRVYAATFVNIYGEESQPGPTVEVVAATDQQVLVENIPQPGSPGTHAPYDKIRLYRTVTGLSGVTEWYKVTDITVATTFFLDIYDSSTVSGHTALESLIWAEPPEMDGIVAMPNGIFVGFKGNNLYFSENYRPHAWPAEYTTTVEYPIVGLGVFGNTCVVLTTGTPAMVSGVKASTMALIKIDAAMPCVSRRSIVSVPEGVLYATPEGIALAGPGGQVTLVSRDLIDRETWRTDFVPDTQKAMMIGGEYVAAYTGTYDAYGFHPANPSSTGVTFFDVTQGVINFGVEPYTGKPWFIGGDSKLYEWEVPGAEPLGYIWKSKEFRYPRPANFKVYQAYFDDSAGELLHLRAWVTLRGNTGTTSRLLVYDQDITKSGSEIRFPSGFKSDVYEFEFSGLAELQEFVIASSVEELRSV